MGLPLGALVAPVSVSVCGGGVKRLQRYIWMGFGMDLLRHFLDWPISWYGEVDCVEFRMIKLNWRGWCVARKDISMGVPMLRKPFHGLER